MLMDILSQLENVRPVSGQWSARCPCHEDRRNSLSVRESDGKWLLFCHAGCDYKDIADKLGILPETPQDKELDTVYDYTDALGNLVYQVVRYRPKGFAQRHWNGEWVWGLQGITPVLFQLPKVLASETVYFVEGEKDALSLGMYGLTATTMSGGSTARWQPGYTDAFENKTVILIPDNDDAGAKWKERVTALLCGWATVRLIILPNSKDVSDFIAQGGDPLSLQPVDAVPPKGYATKEELYDLRSRIFRKRGQDFSWKTHEEG